MKRGFTMIEMVVSLAIIAVLFAAVVIGVGAITGAKAKKAATELSGVIRSLYDTANLTGKTCRLVFELPSEKDADSPVTYHAECAKSALTASKDRDEEQKDNSGEKKKQKEKLAADDKRFRRSDSDEAPTVQELMAREKNRVEEAAKFSAFTSEQIHERSLPDAVRVSVWTKSLREPTKHGAAYIYFFPQGFTERAQIYVRQGSNVWTLSVSPLTGKVATASEELEVPRS
jgi:general secretion pathway protein H